MTVVLLVAALMIAAAIGGVVATLRYGPGVMGERWPSRQAPYDWARHAPEFGERPRPVAFHQSTHVRTVSGRYR